MSDVDIFLELDELSNELVEPYPVDFGFGFPNYFPPDHLLKALETVAQNRSSWELHQYARVKGAPRLCRAVAQLYSTLMDKKIDPYHNVLITVGAIQGVYLTAKAFLNLGDEVIMFEPYYKDYEVIIRLAGGLPVFVPFDTKNGKKPKFSSELTFDYKVFESKFSSKTKMVWINNPNNPSGKAFTKEELIYIAQLCEKHDVLVMADEVAQFYYFETVKHIRFASLPGMWKRTITVQSGGKTFSNTGWRIGWLIAPPELLWPMALTLEAQVGAVPTTMQIAFAMGLEIENKRLNKIDSYYKWVQEEAKNKRDHMLAVLDKFGVEVLKPNAGYFILANFTKLIKQRKIDLSNETESRSGFKLAFWLLRQKNILFFPANVFYSPERKPLAEYVLRICFLKTKEKIYELEKILNDWLGLDKSVNSDESDS